MITLIALATVCYAPLPARIQNQEKRVARKCASVDPPIVSAAREYVEQLAKTGDPRKILVRQAREWSRDKGLSKGNDGCMIAIVDLFLLKGTLAERELSVVRLQELRASLTDTERRWTGYLKVQRKKRIAFLESGLKTAEVEWSGGRLHTYPHPDGFREELAAIMKNEPSFVPQITRFLQKGERGVLKFAKVIHVAGPTEMLAEYKHDLSTGHILWRNQPSPGKMVWISGYDSSGLVDGRQLSSTDVFEIVGTKSYDTNFGTNTVPHLVKLDIDWSKLQLISELARQIGQNK